MSAVAVASLGSKCPALRRLNLHGLAINDQAVRDLAAGCQLLETLHLSSSNPFGGSSELTDEAVLALTRCPHLRCLNLQGASHLTDAGVVELARKCNKMQRLNLGGCYRLTDVAVVHVSVLMRQLSHLSLFQCFKITDRGILSMMKHLTQLQLVDLHSCASLTPAIVETLIHNAEQVSLELLSAPESSASVVAVPSPPSRAARPLDVKTPPVSLSRSSQHQPSLFWPHLQSMDVASCRNIPPSLITQLRTLRSAVHVVHY